MLTKWGPTARTVVLITIGAVLFAIGINAFIVPHKLVGGGISGIALMLFYLTGVPIGTLNLVLNIPILYAAYRWLGRWHLMITLIGTAISSFTINEFAFLQDYSLTQEPLVGAILGGITCGLGLGVVYRSGGNTGGLDPIALIIRKYYGLQMGSIVFAINMVILVISAAIVGVEPAAITLVSLYISAIITNKVIVGFSQRKAIFIISYKPYKICDLIIHHIGRGATILNGEGAYTHQHKQVILVVVGLMQVAKLKAAVQEEDPSAFLLITDAAEVIGRGFTFGSLPEPQQAVQQALHEVVCTECGHEHNTVKTDYEKSQDNHMAVNAEQESTSAIAAEKPINTEAATAAEKK